MSLPHPLWCSITGFAYGHNAMGFRVIYPTTPRLGVTKGSHNNVSAASGHHRPYIRPENRPSAITPPATPYDRRHTSTRVQKWTLDGQSGWYPVPASASAETAAGFVAGPKRSHPEKSGTRSRAHRTGGGTASRGTRGHQVPHRPLPSDRPTVPEPAFRSGPRLPPRAPGAPPDASTAESGGILARVSPAGPGSPGPVEADARPLGRDLPAVRAEVPPPEFRRGGRRFRPGRGGAERAPGEGTAVPRGRGAQPGARALPASPGGGSPGTGARPPAVPPARRPGARAPPGPGAGRGGDRICGERGRRPRPGRHPV
ncbi:hypothetical protein SAMN05421803_13324 [Nocardiopsis flavescens]|uniref:Uncharacterized protein n=1 Tax=Nocardiopsis flavescens TaxID=758803 RepID=A0A1M6VAE1_9ACTN|nr:hypothetical protein SAMN05421803_13324 [Nocardiopsis flavescens]